MKEIFQERSGWGYEEIGGFLKKNFPSLSSIPFSYLLHVQRRISSLPHPRYLPKQIKPRKKKLKTTAAHHQPSPLGHHNHRHPSISSVLLLPCLCSSSHPITDHRARHQPKGRNARATAASRRARRPRRDAGEEEVERRRVQTHPKQGEILFHPELNSRKLGFIGVDLGVSICERGLMVLSCFSG